MPHQDRDGNTADAFNFQALQDALTWLLQSAQLSSIKFRADCTWSPLGLIVTAFFWVWSDKPTLGARFSKARRIAIAVLGRLALGQAEQPATSYQAFMKMLQKWTGRLVEELAATFRDVMQNKGSDRFTIFGFAVFGVDGSRLELPRTKSNQERFSPRKPSKVRRRKRARGRKPNGRKPSQRRAQSERSVQKKVDSPQMWLTMLWHVATGLPWAWRTGPSDSSERHHARDMLHLLPKPALLVADAGFNGYEFWKAIIDSGHHFVIRVGGNVRLLKNLGYARERNGLVYLWPDKIAKKGLPPLVLRLVVARNGRQTIYLVTSVLDPKRLSDKQMVEIYRLRWGIELYYRHFKQTFQRRKLRSTSADNVQVEADWSLLGLWAMGLHAQYVLDTHQIPVKRLSVAKMLSAYRQVMQEYKSQPDEGESLIELLLKAVIDSYQRGSKESRDYPRKKQEPAAGPPKISCATRQQVERARLFPQAA